MPAAFARTATTAQLVTELHAIQSRDMYINEQVRISQRNATGWWIGFAVSVFLLFFSFAILPLLAVTLPAAILCLVFGIIWSVRLSKWKKEDMEDRRLALAHRFLEIIGNDVPAKARCVIGISFDNYKTHGKLVAMEEGGWLNPVSRFKYQDTWFSARGRLCDGNRFRVTIEQTIHRKEKRKRKYTKVNERIVEEISLVLRVSQEGYPNWAQLTQMLQTGIYDGVQITCAQVANGVVRVKGITPMCYHRTGRSGTQIDGADNLASGDTLLKLFLYTYSQLQNCRAAQPASA